MTASTGLVLALQCFADKGKHFVGFKRVPRSVTMAGSARRGGIIGCYERLVRLVQEFRSMLGMTGDAIGIRTERQ
ncbi:hypothetical protein [Woeseia oceani]|uniref:hypothetical protein n=1 Tax=Woeseia oceani TaxID=1548547 RepID=UPI0018D3B626|nr:hypothetical protein [Woeseia oceani]